MKHSEKLYKSLLFSLFTISLFVILDLVTFIRPSYGFPFPSQPTDLYRSAPVACFKNGKKDMRAYLENQGLTQSVEVASNEQKSVTVYFRPDGSGAILSILYADGSKACLLAPVDLRSNKVEERKS